MIRRLIPLLLLIPLLVLAACGPQATPAPATAPTAAAQSAAPAKKFRVALILPSTISDMAWSQSMYEGLKAVQAEMGGESAMEIAYSEKMFNVTDAAAAIRDYASNGYDLVIGHGAQYGTSIFDIAPDFPEVSFAWGTSNDTGESKGLKNVFAYQPVAWQGGYVNGIVASLLSKSGIIGVVGPVEAGDAVLYNAGFKAGVLAAKPDAKVNISYTGSFGDTALAAEAANVHIKAGADVLTGSAQQVVGAIGVAKEQKVYWLSTDTDQSPLAPEVVVGGQVYNWAPALKEMIAMHNSGTMGAKVFQLTFANGGLKYVLNPNVKLPDGVQPAIDAAIKGITEGTIKVEM